MSCTHNSSCYSCLVSSTTWSTFSKTTLILSNLVAKLFLYLELKNCESICIWPIGYMLLFRILPCHFFCVTVEWGHSSIPLETVLFLSFLPGALLVFQQLVLLLLSQVLLQVHSPTALLLLSFLMSQSVFPVCQDTVSQDIYIQLSIYWLWYFTVEICIIKYSARKTRVFFVVYSYFTVSSKSLVP